MEDKYLKGIDDIYNFNDEMSVFIETDDTPIEFIEESKVVLDDELINIEDEDLDIIKPSVDVVLKNAKRNMFNTFEPVSISKEDTEEQERIISDIFKHVEKINTQEDYDKRFFEDFLRSLPIDAAYKLRDFCKRHAIYGNPQLEMMIFNQMNILLCADHTYKLSESFAHTAEEVTSVLTTNLIKNISKEIKKLEELKEEIKNLIGEMRNYSASVNEDIKLKIQADVKFIQGDLSEHLLSSINEKINIMAKDITAKVSSNVSKETNLNVSNSINETLNKSGLNSKQLVNTIIITSVCSALATSLIVIGLLKLL